MNSLLPRHRQRLAIGFLVVVSQLHGLHQESSADQPSTTVPNQRVEEEWIDLFNGQNLEGWTVKIAGHRLGENYADTFRVEDGILKCEYDDYQEFGGRYGHLFSNLAYSHYRLRLEYRFVGRMVSDAPNYVDLNSGVMLHAQPPQSMELDQGFPASLEMQFLADLGTGKRQTGNVCTPGTHVVYDGKLTKQHIVKSSGPTLPPDRWVAVEMEVRGHEEIVYYVEGQEVLRYRNPQLDLESKEAKPILRGARRFRWRLAISRCRQKASGSGFGKSSCCD